MNAPILAALSLYAFAGVFILGACRLSGRADDLSQHFADQLADGDGVGVNHKERNT